MRAKRQLHTNGGGGLGLESRFALFVAAIATILAGIVFTTMLLTERMGRDEAHTQSAKAVAGAAVAARGELFTSSDRAVLDAAVAAMAENPMVQRVELYDAAGALAVARSKQGEVGAPATNDVRQAMANGQPHSTIKAERISIVTPLVRDGQAVGAVRHVIQRTALPQSQPSALPFLLAGFLGVLALGLPIAIGMARRITEPLQKLTEFAKRVSAQSQVEPISMRTGDEFETLAGAFNSMIARFDDSLRRIERLAFRDPATDLPNIPGANRILADAIQLSIETGNAGVVFVLRIERLENVIEMIGADRAQDLIGMIGGRLRQRVKAIDQAIRLGESVELPSVLARMTGPDFCIIVPSFASGVDAARFAQRLAQSLSQPLEWREQTLSFGARVGAAVFPRDGEDPDTILRHALLAANAAGSEPSKARFFAKEMEKAAARRIAAEREIRNGIEQRAFVAHFQPKIDLKTRKVVGAEALARWVQPNGSIVSPAHFIGPAEEFGLIGPISEAILLDSCWKAASWAREGEPVRVAVNVSPLQLADEKFTERVKRVLLETGMPPDLLELEITESVALTNTERAIRLLSPLKDMGVSIALDDFGTGHSSLGSLSKLPFDVVKIDQSFVRALATDPHAPAIIDTILTLADRLGCSVVAEGVETEQEAEWLLRQGCRIVQGFLFGPAMTPNDFRRMQLSFGRSEGSTGTGWVARAV